MYRSLSRGHPMGSKPLRTLLEGHAAQRARKFRRLRWRDSSSLIGWQHAVVYGLSNYGWRPLRPWVLQRPQEGQCHVLQDDESAMRKFRESWRHFLFEQFLFQNRRGSNLLRGQVLYDSKSCKLARSLYESSGNHSRAVLVGAALPTAVYCRIRKEDVS